MPSQQMVVSHSLVISRDLTWKAHVFGYDVTKTSPLSAIPNQLDLESFCALDQYPLPKPADLMTCITGGQSFSKLDLTAAYQQLLPDDESAKLVAINTHQGLYELDFHLA